MENDKKMVEQRSWKEFKDTGLLWFINQLLHLFGWAIVFEIDNERNNTITNVYPARVKFRGFAEKSNDRGYRLVSQYLKNNIDELLSECESEL